MKRFWTSTKDDTDDVDRVELLTDLLNRNGHWIQAADAKAGVILVFLTAIVGGLIRPTISAVTRLITSFSTLPEYTTILFSIALIASVLFAALTLYYVITSLLPSIDRPGSRGVIFFGDVAQYGPDAWNKKVLEVNHQTLVEHLAEQVHTTAIIADVKHARIWRAIICLAGLLVSSTIMYGSGFLIGLIT